MVIGEWGVRFTLSKELQNNIAYSIAEPVVDPDGIGIQAVKLFLRNDPKAGNECAIVQTAQGQFIDAAAQVLRTEKGKPVSSGRYKGTFKEGLLTDDIHNYHLNYAPPDCASAATATQIERLLTDLRQSIQTF